MISRECPSVCKLKPVYTDRAINPLLQLYSLYCHTKGTIIAITKKLGQLRGKNCRIEIVYGVSNKTRSDSDC